MSILTTSVTQIMPGLWSIGWASGLGAVDVWMNGALLTPDGITAHAMTIMSVPEPAVEIVAHRDAAQSQILSNVITLQWRGVSGVDGYIVERYDHGRWRVLGTPPETGIGYYRFKSAAQPDGTAAQYRVSSQTGAVKGAALVFDTLVTAFPTKPPVNMELQGDSDGPYLHITALAWGGSI